MTAPRLTRRDWVPVESEALVQGIAATTAGVHSRHAIRERVTELVEMNRTIHERECINLNPAANVMSPAAEALLSTSLGSRPSLGYPGDKYEMGLEAVEQIEVVAAELAAEVFDAPFAEVRVGSGALANLYAFMACCHPGDAIVVPPATIGGHVTHNVAGAAGLYGLEIHEAPVDPDRYTVDVAGLSKLARRVRPRLISIGSSLNLTHHPVTAIRTIADDIGAAVLFDAAHLSGLIAGGVWPNPLHEGAHVMTMSTYKSLAGPPAGLLVTTDAALAERVDAIAFPGLTANFDAANTAALAVTLLDWQDVGAAHASTMVKTATSLSQHLLDAGLPVVTTPDGFATASHAFAVRADATAGDGQQLARRLRMANLLTSAIGIPGDTADGMGAIRIGTNEVVRWGMTPADMDVVGDALVRAVRGDEPSGIATDVTAFRRRFDRIHFCR